MEQSRNVIICLCLAYALSFVQCNEEVKHSNPECKPYKTIIPIESHHHDTHSYSPSAVEVYRCMGAHIANEGCAVIKEEKVEFTVTKKLRADGVEENVKVVKNNHTQCAMRCSCSPNPRFQCPNTDQYKIPCPEGLSWDFKSCECKSTNVGCSKEKDDDDEVSISLPMFLMALGIEFFIVLIGVVLIMDACKNRSRDGHNQPQIRLASHQNGKGTLRKDRSDTGSESFLCYSDIKVNV